MTQTFHYAIYANGVFLNHGRTRAASFGQALKQLRAVWRAFGDVQISLGLE